MTSVSVSLLFILFCRQTWATVSENEFVTVPAVKHLKSTAILLFWFTYSLISWDIGLHRARQQPNILFSIKFFKPHAALSATLESSPHHPEVFALVTSSVSALHDNTSQAVFMAQALILDLPLNGDADKAPPPSIVELVQYDSHPFAHVNHQTGRTLRWRCGTVHSNRFISALFVIMATSHFGRNNVHAAAFRSDHSEC